MSNRKWNVEYTDNDSGELVNVIVEADDWQSAISTASTSKELMVRIGRPLYFKRCNQVSAHERNV